MAILIAKPVLDLKINMLIDEGEARALDALAGYGTDAFIKAFYTNLGAAYMMDHEKSLRRFLTSMREQIPGILSTFDEAKSIYNIGFIHEVHNH